MKTPARFAPLMEDGIVDEVISQLKSGKEATVYLVRCGNAVRCAKVYKEATQRSFRQATEYQEGRKVKNSRRARAMEKGSRYGKREQESSWQSAEVDALYKLASAGVRVPKPHGFFDGVLLMDVVRDVEGYAAPRLNDVSLTEAEALEHHHFLLRQVVLMLCAGLVHGDLSEFNILLAEEGPVIIDLPQAVDATANPHAARMLERDVTNLADYFGQFAPQLQGTQYGKEIWQIFEKGELTPETVLTGRVEESTRQADVDGVMREIRDAIEEERMKQERLREME
jgi:RIO kinase 1